jgi:hypothetical protein
MNKIRIWINQNYNQIAWFLIGWLSLATLKQFSVGNWAGMFTNIVLIALTYYLNKRDR